MADDGAIRFGRGSLLVGCLPCPLRVRAVAFVNRRHFVEEGAVLDPDGGGLWGMGEVASEPHGLTETVKECLLGLFYAFKREGVRCMLGL